MRWLQLTFAGLFLFALSACIDGNPSKLVAVDGFMRHAMFSADGSRLIALVAHARQNPEPPDIVVEIPDTVVVWEVGTWKKLFEHTPSGTSRIWRAYTCADPDVIIHSWDDHPVSEDQTLIWRSLSTGEELGRLEVGELPGYSEWGNSYCDLEENILYLDIGWEKLVAVDGSTGTVLREYDAPGVGDYDPFFIQKDVDRLVRVDKENDLVWIYRLSSGELLHRVEAWIGLRPVQSPQYGLLSRDILLYGLTASDNGPIGSHVVSVDLSVGSTTRDYFLGEYDFDSLYIMDFDGDTVALTMHAFEDLCSKIWTLNLSSGEGGQKLDMCTMGDGGAMAIPEKGVFLAGDWSHPSGAESYFYLYDYPSFELLGEGPAPQAYEEKQYSSRQNILVMESYFSDHFGVYDLGTARMKDDFHLCTNIYANSLALDPTERWAAVRCDGNAPGKLKVGSTAGGAGIAVMDLDRYR